jgi:hypothetical protein
MVPSSIPALVASIVQRDTTVDALPPGFASDRSSSAWPRSTLAVAGVDSRQPHQQGSLIRVARACQQSAPRVARGPACSVGRVGGRLTSTSRQRCYAFGTGRRVLHRHDKATSLDHQGGFTEHAGQSIFSGLCLAHRHLINKCGRGARGVGCAPAPARTAPPVQVLHRLNCRHTSTSFDVLMR